MTVPGSGNSVCCGDFGTLNPYSLYLFSGLRAILIFFIIISTLSTVTAVSITVDGNGYVGEQLNISLDKEAFVILRMNNGTPIFAEGKEFKYIPSYSGRLSIEAIEGTYRVVKTVSVVENQEKSPANSDTGTQKPVYSLPDSTFFKKDTEGKDHTFRYRTAIGALQKTSQILGISYEIKGTSMGPYVRCIGGICEKSMGSESGWMYWVNYGSADSPSLPASEFELEEGDELIWFFSTSIGGDPTTALYSIKIDVKKGFYIEIEDNIIGSTEKLENTVNNEGAGVLKPAYGFGNDEIKVYGNKNSVITDVDLNLSSINCSCTYNLTEEISNSTGVTSVGFEREIKENRFSVSSTDEDLSSYRIYAGIYKTFSVYVEDETAGLIKFKIQKSWLEKNNYDKEDVVLLKIIEERYIEVPTWVSGEDEIGSSEEGENTGGYVYYIAELPSSSTYVIAAKWDGFPLKPEDERISRAVNWLKTLQRDNGGFANPENAEVEMGESELETTISKTSWAILAFVSADIDPNEVKIKEKSPVDYIKDNLGDSINKMGTIDYALTILALKSANRDENIENIGGINLLGMLKERVNEDGQIGDYVHTTIWGILALRECDVEVERNVQWLKQQQNEDGGFSWSVGGESDYDDTAAAIQALIASGEPYDSDTIKNALEFLRGGQNPDGGFKYFGTSSSNAASDGWVIQALISANQNPENWKKSNVSVVEHLLSLQTEEGYFRYTNYQTSNPGYMTVCALMALTGNYHPILPQSGFPNHINDTEMISNLMGVSQTSEPAIEKTNSGDGKLFSNESVADTGLHKEISGYDGQIPAVNLPSTGIILIILAGISFGLIAVYLWRSR